MDFTMAPNERELAELRKLLTCVEAAEEPKSARRAGPISRVSSQHLSRAGHSLGGEQSLTKGRLCVVGLSISIPVQ